MFYEVYCQESGRSVLFFQLHGFRDQTKPGVFFDSLGLNGSKPRDKISSRSRARKGVICLMERF